MRRTISALALPLLVAVPSAAQPAGQPTIYDRAIAAGYKALTLCSAIFTAQAALTTRTPASVKANELKGIYSEYDPLIAALPAQIGERSVRVAYDPAMPPRVATSDTQGCTIFPIGTTFAQAEAMTSTVTINYGGAPVDWPRRDREIAETTAPLRPLVDAAFDASSYGAASNTTAVVVVRDGALVAERYAPGFGIKTPQRTWSVAKSLAGTLVGVAVGKGLLDPKSPAPVPEWQTPGDPRGRITLDDLLRMASGLHSETAGNRTDAVYFGGTAVTEETVGWPLEAPPGTRFRYANNDILLAVRALAARLEAGERESYPTTLLLPQIDMLRTYPERDWKGNFILSSQVWSTARDLARLGMFWLADGVWDGERILPEGWMRYMTTPSGPQPATGPGYGATLWLFGPAQGLPEGSYAAQGNRGQFVMVIPSRKLVVVRRGEDPSGARFDIARFAADVVGALP